MSMLEVGLAPGMQPMSSDLYRLRSQGLITKWEMKPQKLILYLRSLQKDVSFSFKVQGYYSIRATVPRSRLYSYYNPDAEAFSMPFPISIQ